MMLDFEREMQGFERVTVIEQWTDERDERPAGRNPERKLPATGGDTTPRAV